MAEKKVVMWVALRVASMVEKMAVMWVASTVALKA